jgi:superfamily II DNA or RNA helicase
LLTDEVYAAGLRDALGEFRPRTLFILDEAHHAAPAAGLRYAISSQLTKAVRELGERFEHRLFLTATPHNGHSNGRAQWTKWAATKKGKCRKLRSKPLRVQRQPAF